jgi:phosphatidate cytidylyltransferase
VFAVELNDVLAFTAGRLFGRRKLCPNTNPDKTVAGALGALIGTTILMVIAGKFVFAGTELDNFGRLAVLGILVSVSGQMGTLMLASIKRDVGIKDMDVIIPGHGGLLDRFDSLILVAPVAYHVMNFFAGLRVEETGRVFTG